MCISLSTFDYDGDTFDDGWRRISPQVNAQLAECLEHVQGWPFCFSPQIRPLFYRVSIKCKMERVKNGKDARKLKNGIIAREDANPHLENLTPTYRVQLPSVSVKFPIPNSVSKSPVNSFNNFFFNFFLSLFYFIWFGGPI